MNEHTGERTVPTTEIEKVRALEKGHYQAVKKTLGDTVSLTADLLDLYETLVSTSVESEVIGRDEIAAGSPLPRRTSSASPDCPASGTTRSRTAPAVP